MSASTVITMGFGPSATVALVITQGYGSSDAPAGPSTSTPTRRLLPITIGRRTYSLTVSTRVNSANAG